MIEKKKYIEPRNPKGSEKEHRKKRDGRYIKKDIDERTREAASTAFELRRRSGRRQ